MSAHGPSRRELNETISIAIADDGSGAVRLLPAEDSATDAAAASPAMGTLEIGRASLLKALGLDDHVAARRYRLRGMLGMGSTGQVFEVDDADLARVAAVKVLQADRPDRNDLTHFIQEAQITASLTHPHVLPIYDIDSVGDGRIYFTMPRIEGRSLGTLLGGTDGLTVDPTAHGLLDDPNALVTVAIAIAQVLAFAHHRNIVHQDIKPDNIMIGDFGEVWLLDWGSAVRLAPNSKPRLYGTPLYMSPEQARAEHVDPRSDIYCLGATLFHALVRRCPTWDADPDAFWRKKRAGAIDAPTAPERARVPAVLLDIALKAMAADPAARYASAEALVGDLQAYQRGLAVTAHREGAIECAVRLWRAHGRRWSAIAAVVAVILVLAGMLYGERLKEIARWGRPILVDDFVGPVLSPQWQVIDGGFRVDGGRLVSTDSHESRILLDRRLSGPTAIEYDAEILPGSHRGDISLTWWRDRALVAKKRGPAVSEAVGFQIGAFDGAFSAIRDGNQTVAFSDFKPQVGRSYHIRDEIIGDRVSMSVDGRELCSWRSQFPLDDGYLVFYFVYQEHACSRLRVYSQGVAQKIPATAIGDALVELRRYDDAAQAYARVAASFGDSELGREARFREGLCRWRLAQWDAAFAAWAPLSGTPQQGFVTLYQLKRDFTDQRYDAVCAGLERLCADAAPELRSEIALTWGEDAEELCRFRDLNHVQQYLAMHDRCLVDQTEVDGQCADCLLSLDRDDEVLSRFPHQEYYCSSALQHLQRFPDIIARFPDQVWIYNLALLRTAQDERIEKELDPYAWDEALFRTCRFDELMKRTGCHEEICYALLAQGKLDELDRSDPPVYVKNQELALTGRVDQVTDATMRLIQSDQAEAAIKKCSPHTELYGQAQMRIALDAYIASGDATGMEAVEQDCGRDDGDFTERIASYRNLLVPFLKARAGGWASFDAALAQEIRDDRYLFQQQIWYAASWLTGAIDDRAFLAQPHRLYVQARLALISGLRAERAGNTPAALAAYRAWQAMPAWQRDCELDPVWNRFVTWRCELLAPAR
jgi:hypothetical protein